MLLYLVGSISSVGSLNTGDLGSNPMEPGIFFQVFFPTYLSVTASSLLLMPPKCTQGLKLSIRIITMDSASLRKDGDFHLTLKP